MGKTLLVCVMFLAVVMIGGCGSSGTQLEKPTPSLTTMPVSASTSTPETTRPEINIPIGTIPTINGRIEEGEWDAAAVEELDDGTLLYLMYAEDALYLALDSDVLGTVNVGVVREGELWILHSSAALGSVIYQPEENSWKLRQTFEWCCRTTSPLSESDQLLANEGWMSHNQFVGDETQTEYLIQIPKDEILLAVTYRYRDDSRAAFWPDLLGENDLLKFTTEPKIGDKPFFSSDLWASLIVSD